MTRRGSNMVTAKKIELYKAQGKEEFLQRLICSLNNCRAEMLRPRDLASTLLGVLDFTSVEIEKLEAEVRKEQDNE